MSREPYFEVETTVNEALGQSEGEFKSRYGSLNLSMAHSNNFKVDNIKEYEYVQR